MITNNGTTHWTKSAVDCYKRGCRCEGCFYNTFFTQSSDDYVVRKCQMKKAVLELVREHGTPEENNIVVEITKEIVEDLYLKKKLNLVEIYRILRISKYEFNNILDLYNIKRRKKPRASGRLEDN